MNRWRLMHSAYDRLEIVNVECPRVEIPIPADDIEWVMVENELIEAVVLLHEQAKITHLVVRLELDRSPDVALRIGRAFLQLPELVAISFGPTHVSAALHDEELWLIPLHVELEAMQNAAMDDEVVSLPKWEIAEHGLQRAGALGDVHDLVSLRVAIEVRVLLVGLDVQHRDVG